MHKANSLKPLQLSAIQLLAIGTPANQIAARLEITTMTLYRWQKLPEFETKLRALTSSGMEEIARKMNIAGLTAIEVLQEIMCNIAESKTTQMKAAIGVLNAMSAVNGVLEKSLKHRVGDFDLQKRWNETAFSYDMDGNPCQQSRIDINSLPDMVEV